MPSSELVLLTVAGLAVIALGLLAAPTLAWARRQVIDQADGRGGSTIAMADPGAGMDDAGGKAGSRALVPVAERLDGDEPLLTGPLAPAASDPTLESRVIRIVSWAFLMAVAVFAAASVSTDRLPTIVVVIAIAGFATLVLQDVLPRTAIRRLGGPLQATLALAFAAGIVYLTGGFESPFTFAFPLIVGAGALLVAPRTALALAILATAAYIGAGFAVNQNPSTTSLILMGVNLTGVYLLAYVGASVGREQRRARDAAIRLSTIDSLTGLSNRTYFFTALEREIARGDRSGRAFCLVMLDLDDLKAINDRFGHIAGDQVLRTVADIVRSGVRKIDVAARYGGDEFVALLPETDPTGGWVLAEKVRLMVAEQGMPGVDPGPTVSVGVVSYPADGRSADALLVSADRAMYASKRAGKNRVARAANEPLMLAIEPNPEEKPAAAPKAARESERAGERAG
jgi:diguanylate cyclase (GGDEF)-like protein